MPHKDPAKREAYQREYRKKNAKKLAAAQKAYIAAQPEDGPYKTKLRARKAANIRRYRAENPEHFRAMDLKSKHRDGNRINRNLYLIYCYGVTIEDYERMFAEQNGMCAICKKPETTIRKGKLMPLSVDHCHKTGKVRGLLCKKHNSAIGLLEDDVDLVMAAGEYLKRYL